MLDLNPDTVKKQVYRLLDSLREKISRPLIELFIIFLKGRGNKILNFGVDFEEAVDYPDFAHEVSCSVENGQVDLGILICGSGQGMAMAANKHQKIRAAICWLPEIAEPARKHNDANVICLPSRFVTTNQAIEIIKSFLNSEFEVGRHFSRVEKIGFVNM